MRAYGRLLLLKETLISLIDQSHKLDIKTLALFQLKDFCRRDDDKLKEFC